MTSSAATTLKSKFKSGMRLRNLQLVCGFVSDDCIKDFYEDLFEELSKYGDLESLNICDNLVDHMGW